MKDNDLFEMNAADIIKVMNGPDPVSIIRCGDGEKVILDGYNNPDFIQTFLRQIGYYHEEQAQQIRNNLIEAIGGCDILGIPKHKHIDNMGSDWMNVETTINKFIPGATKKRCSTDVHIDLMNEGYEQFLTDKKIALITCRDLSDRVALRFNARSVDWFEIAPEVKFTSYDGERHYPIQFNKVKPWLSLLHPETILLVGAGIVGKIYCNWFRDLGGKAMDIGSVMDEWDGRVTRGPEREIDKVKVTEYTL